jgi:hypothetical protein
LIQPAFLHALPEKIRPAEQYLPLLRSTVYLAQKVVRSLG